MNSKYFLKSNSSRFFYSGIIILMMSLFSACGGSNSTPEGAVEIYLSCAADQDVECMLQSFDPKSMEQAGVKEKMQTMLQASLEQSKGRDEVLKSWDILESKVDGDQATVKVKMNFENGESKEDKVKVQQVDGKWYIVL